MFGSDRRSMRRPGRAHRNRAGREDRGAALVEFAIVAPLFFLLIFGIIEFGSAYNDYQSIRQGAREGARQAVVGDYGGAGVDCGLNGGAVSAPDNAKRILCLTKARTGLGNSLRVRLVLVDNSPLNDNRGDPVKICTVRRVSTITGFLDPFIEGIPLKTEIEMRGEQRNLGVAPGTYSETDPSGDNWAWC